MYETKNIIIYSMKLFIMNLFTYCCFSKISNVKKNNVKDTIILLILNILITLVSTYINLRGISFYLY